MEALVEKLCNRFSGVTGMNFMTKLIWISYQQMLLSPVDLSFVILMMCCRICHFCQFQQYYSVLCMLYLFIVSGRLNSRGVNGGFFD